jgi:hypothetical protein
MYLLYCFKETNSLIRVLASLNLLEHISNPVTTILKLKAYNYALIY